MKVSIITIDYNNPEITQEMLASLERVGVHQHAEVIVVDNGSAVSSEYEYKAQFPWLKFVRSEKNLGFAGGNNLGMRYATGEYIFLLNNDTELKEDIVSTMVSILERNTQIGILCPEIRYYEQPEVIQYTGFTPINPITGRNKCLTSILGTNECESTHFPHGAAMLISRKVIEQVGPMPELFFLYYEEHDWTEIIRRAGYQIGVTPKARVYHKESMSVSRIGELKMYFMTRNRILFMRRNYPGIGLAIFWIYFLLIATPKNMLGLLFRNDWDNIKALLAGIRWNISSSVSSEKLGYKFDHLKVT